jgi:hypothetical protein
MRTAQDMKENLSAFFSKQSHKKGLKVGCNKLLTPTRLKGQKVQDWLVEQHTISRDHVIQTARNLAAAFEKSISQHISSAHPLQKSPYQERDEEFLTNLQWMLGSWNTIRPEAYISIEGRSIDESISFFEASFQQMVTVIPRYLEHTTITDITQIQKASHPLLRVLREAPIVLSPDLTILRKALDELNLSFPPTTLLSRVQQLNTMISVAQENIAVTQPLQPLLQNAEHTLPLSKSPSNVEQFRITLVEQLAIFKEQLQIDSKESERLMLSVIARLQDVVGESIRAGRFAIAFFRDLSNFWPTDDLILRLQRIEEDTARYTGDTSGANPVSIELAKLFAQEYTRVKEEIQRIETEARKYFTEIVRGFSVDPANRLMQLNEAIEKLPYDEHIIRCDKKVTSKIKELFLQEQSNIKQRISELAKEQYLRYSCSFHLDLALRSIDVMMTIITLPAEFELTCPPLNTEKLVITELKVMLEQESTSLEERIKQDERTSRYFHELFQTVQKERGQFSDELRTRLEQTAARIPIPPAMLEIREKQEQEEALRTTLLEEQARLEAFLRHAAEELQAIKKIDSPVLRLAAVRKLNQAGGKRPTSLMFSQSPVQTPLPSPTVHNAKPLPLTQDAASTNYTQFAVSVTQQLRHMWW